MELKNRTAIVTGAGSGIGRAIALAYAREGANVVVSDIVEEGGRETVALIEKGGAKAHIACNNAGIGGELNPVGDMSILAR